MIAGQQVANAETYNGLYPGPTLKVNPGDVLFHNVLVLHGSPPAQTKLRRVLYYEFRPGEVEREFGPHTPEYGPLKQQILIAPAENHVDFGTFNSVFSSDGIAKTNLVGQLEPGRGERQIEKAAQLSGERYAVNLSVLDKWL